jgi:hypothetical protein
VFRDGLSRLQQFDRYTGPVSYLQFETRGSDAGEAMNLRATNVKLKNLEIQRWGNWEMEDEGQERTCQAFPER